MRIVWHKWKPPFNHYSGDLKTVDEIEADDSWNKDEKDNSFYSGPVCHTPQGLIPLHEHVCPSRLYNFWIGHTNFNISEAVRDQIKRAPGVEVLMIPTRYRFIIAIGQAFDEDAVKKEIDNLFADKKTVIEQVGEQMKKKYQYWAIVKDKGGKLNTFGDSSRAVVEAKIAEFHEPEEVMVSWK